MRAAVRLSCIVIMGLSGAAFGQGAAPATPAAPTVPAAPAAPAAGDAKAPGMTEAITPGEHMDELLQVMEGSFSSEKQSKADPEYFEIHLHMTRIWKDRKDGAWLYVEQAAAAALEKPYRQRIYHVTALPDGGYQSDVYTLPGDPLAVTGAWKDPAKLGAIKPEDLKKKDGCGVILHRTAKGVFDGGTEGNGCASDLRGAAYATSKVHAEPTGLRTWDQGFDKDGKQVWGAVKGPYQFDRVKDDAPASPDAKMPHAGK